MAQEHSSAEDEGPIWIACIPKIPGVAKPPACIGLERCRECGCRIWVAPSTVEILLCRADIARPVCIPCWVQHMKENPDDWQDFKVATTQRQDDEVRLHAGVSVEEACERLFGITPEMLNLKGPS